MHRLRLPEPSRNPFRRLYSRFRSISFQLARLISPVGRRATVERLGSTPAFGAAIVVVATVASLGAAVGMLILGTPSFWAQTQSLSKEYIYSGSKLLVVEQPVTVTPPCVAPVATSPVVPSDTIWVDEQVPAGAATQGTWSWDTTQKVGGAQSNTQAAATGIHEQSFFGASQTLTINTGDKLISYVLINPCSPPRRSC
jgi:hypothetical protein